MNSQTQEKKYVCKSCGSESSGNAGSCCGAERKEKSEDFAKKCEMCGHEHKSDGSCDCGCK